MTHQIDSIANPDFEEAERFLSARGAEDRLYLFMTVDDRRGTSKDRSLTRVFYGNFDQHKNDLAQLNLQGAGTFICANDPGGIVRRKENFASAECLHCDDDRTFAGVFPLEPHASIATSEGKFQHWWFVGEGGLTPDEHAAAMDVMVTNFGCDPAAKDISRILRLPGFWHQKNPTRPHLVRIVHLSGAQPYSRDAIRAAFIRASLQKRDIEERAPFCQLARDQVLDIRSALAFIDPSDRAVWLSIGMALHSTNAQHQAFELWAQWSQTTKRGNYDPDDQTRVWASFGNYDGKRTSLATLFDQARSGGWVSPARLSSPATPVTDISEESAARIDYEQRIPSVEPPKGAVSLGSSISPQFYSAMVEAPAEIGWLPFCMAAR